MNPDMTIIPEASITSSALHGGMLAADRRDAPSVIDAKVTVDGARRREDGAVGNGGSCDPAVHVGRERVSFGRPPRVRLVQAGRRLLTEDDVDDSPRGLDPGLIAEQCSGSPRSASPSSRSYGCMSSAP